LPASNLEKVSISGDAVKNGFYDVSVEYGDDGVGWLAYSRVEIPKYVGTHLAKSTDRGRTWKHVAMINESPDRDGGVWRNETASLLYDRKDVPKRRWKLFSQRYFTRPKYKPKDRMFKNSWVEYRYAATPNGPWSEPVPLFGNRKTRARIDLSALDNELRSMSHFNEIGSIEVGGVIYLSLDASTTHSGFGEWEKRKIILVSSSDHAMSWNYAGTLTDYDDADAFGYRVFTGSSLTREGNRLYALLTPSGARKGRKKGHAGTWVVEFEDISKARLKRDEQGRLLIVNKFGIEFDSGGLADYDEKNTYGGLLISMVDTRARPDVFQTYSTRRRLTEK
jgi:hypothetical protein